MFNLRQAKEKENEPMKVGTGVLIIKDNCILLGKRKVEVGNGMYALPGGSLEEGESLEECAIREVKEETNLTLDSVEKIGQESDAENYLCHYFKAYLDNDSELENVEPDKSGDWEWYSVDALPEPLFGRIDLAVKEV